MYLQQRRRMIEGFAAIHINHKNYTKKQFLQSWVDISSRKIGKYIKLAKIASTLNKALKRTAFNNMV